MGPAINYPAQAAAKACGVLYNLDVFSTDYAKRGLIKAMLLMVKECPNKGEQEKLGRLLESLYQRHQEHRSRQSLQR